MTNSSIHVWIIYFHYKDEKEFQRRRSWAWEHRPFSDWDQSAPWIKKDTATQVSLIIKRRLRDRVEVFVSFGPESLVWKYIWPLRLKSEAVGGKCRICFASQQKQRLSIPIVSGNPLRIIHDVPSISLDNEKRNGQTRKILVREIQCIKGSGTGGPWVARKMSPTQKELMTNEILLRIDRFHYSKYLFDNYIPEYVILSWKCFMFQIPWVLDPVWITTSKRAKQN